MIVRPAGASAAPPAASANPAPAPSPGDVQFVRWANTVNVAVSDNNLRKTSGCDGCPDGLATAEQAIAGEGGALQFVAGGNGLGLIGLSSGGSATPAEVEFGLRVQNAV